MKINELSNYCVEIIEQLNVSNSIIINSKQKFQPHIGNKGIFLYLTPDIV